MPIDKTYYDEKTLDKVIRELDYLYGGNIARHRDAVISLQNAGILFRERLRDDEEMGVREEKVDLRTCVGITTACKDREEVERVLEYHSRTAAILANAGIYSNIDIFPYANIHQLP